MGQCCVGNAEKQEEEFADIRDEEAETKSMSPKAKAGDNRGQQAVSERLARYAAEEEKDSMEGGEEKDEVERSPSALQEDKSSEEAAKSPEEALKKKLQEMDEKERQKKAQQSKPAKPLQQDQLQSPAAASPAASQGREETQGSPGAPVSPQAEDVATPPPPPKKLTLKEKEAAEEAERVEADRKRKEEILAEGGVKKAQTFTWKDEDLEVEDDKAEIVMDGEDVILEMDDDEQPTPEKDTTAEKPPYPSSEWYEANGVKPPASLTYFHVRDTLTLTFKPAPPSTKLTFTPPAVVHYKTPENEAYLDLLHDGCTEPRLLSAAIPCMVSASEDDLREQVAEVVKEMVETAGLGDGYAVEVKQIAELTLQSCSCMVRLVGPVGGLDKIQAVNEQAAKLKGFFAEGAEYCDMKFKLMEEQSGESVTIRLKKPSTARWSSVIKPQTGEALQPPPSWITPDDIDTDDEDDYT